MLFLVPKMTLNNGPGLPVVLQYMFTTPTFGNPDGFKGLRGLDCNAKGD